mmetsp:Transcript_1190/g.3449  ORF Transcript_1190/g.3449 Transcript_1190/m.3449 type:complete len:262 (-) Transcript_1190:2940-3725(-)
MQTPRRSEEQHPDMTSNNRSSSSLGLPVPQDEPCDDTTSRSELKRRREKQRRLDVRMAFEELSTIISLIDPGMVNIDAGRKRRKKTSDQDNANRVEIIHRATKIMRRLHHENEATKQMLTQMRNTTHHRYTDEGKVLVMVPTLALVEQQQQPPVAKATYPTYYQKQMVHQTMVPDYPQYIHSPILDQHNVYSPNGGSSAWGEPLRSLPVSMSAPHINLDVSKRTSHSSTKPADGNNATGLMGFFNSAGHFGGGSAGEGGRC